MSLKSLASFSQNEEIEDILKRTGYKEKTRIQEVLLPFTEKKDVIGLSETGTGKTACFVIPIVEELAEDSYGIHSLILTPTRELCLQTKEQIDIVGHYFGVTCEMLHGGIDVHRQVPLLQNRPHVVVSTPGRLATMLYSQDNIKCFRRLKKIVLDEADLLLNGTQAKPVHTILETLLAQTPAQLLLFSATDIVPRVSVKSRETETETDENANAEEEAGAPAAEAPHKARLEELVEKTEVPELWRLVQKRAFAVHDVRTEAIPKKIVQEYSLVHRQAKDAHLADLLLGEYAEDKVVVFMNRSTECTVLAKVFQELGINAEALSRHMDHRDRLSAFNSFRAGQVRVLLTTDIASRGIDVKDVSLVINCDLPNDPVDYIHRIGRTGRLLAEGRALSFVAEADLYLFAHIQKETGAQIAEKKLKPFDSPKLMNKISGHKEWFFQRTERGVPKKA
ncbi:ATP-dependent RNA helicase DDX49/DBP8 [Nematocida sp. AWRm77]|nr:ATP-dependent RNA helicase DDX49/DBP8 [Nematocida sp. AWRm77]